MQSLQSGKRTLSVPWKATKLYSCNLISSTSYKSFQWSTVRRNRQDLFGMCRATDGEQAVPEVALDYKAIPTQLNTIPHTREIRKFFYDDVTDAVRKALSDDIKRMSIRCTIPETNTEFDVYRVGTLLEMVRDIVLMLTADGRKVKVCVQQALGQGVFQGTPMPLNGVSRIMKQMDWGSAAPFMSTGNIGAGEVEGSDAFVLIAPQNIVGYSIVPFLSEMVRSHLCVLVCTGQLDGDAQPIRASSHWQFWQGPSIDSSANPISVSSSQPNYACVGLSEDTHRCCDEQVEAAEAQGKPLIILNPKLGDIPSSGGVMGIMGRQGRQDFAKTFMPAYHFRLLYISASMYPIMGALRYSYGGQWEVYERVELGQRQEEYKLIGKFDEEPKPPQITQCFRDSGY